MIAEKDIQRIKDLKKEIEEAKQDLAEWKGQKKELLKQLQEQFGISTLKEAEIVYKQWENEEQQLEKEIQEGIKQLEVDYDF